MLSMICLLLAGPNILALTVKIAQIVIVALVGRKTLFQMTLLATKGSFASDQRKRAGPADVAHHAAMVPSSDETCDEYFLGRVHVGRRPLDSLSRHDVHLHPMLNHVEDARRNQALDLGSILGP